MAGQRNHHGKRQSDYPDNGGSKRRHPGEERDTYVPGPEDTDQDWRKRSGCDERVITIFSASRETNTFEDSDEKACPAQDALFRVHERLVTDEMPDDENEAGSPQVSVRLLVPSDQIGCIIGKGGQIIQGIRSDTGAQIRILKNEHLPACAISGDELLQITGDASIVKKALFQISSRLHDNPSRSQHLLASSMSQGYPGQFGASAPVVGMGPIISPYGGYKGDVGGDWPPFYPLPGMKALQGIRQESGAFIKVDSTAAEDDSIILISAKEFFEDPISPSIDAAVRLQPRCSEKNEAESGEPTYTTRLLVSTSRIGCLIGKGGSIISEMRRGTKANIRVLSKENVPKVAAEDDEMVQITGELDVARNALVQITTRLKANFFEREGALPPFPPPPVPYHPLPSSASDGSKYSSRDGKVHGRGYSYSGGYGGSSEVLPSEKYGSYGGSQGGGSSYGSYSGYSGRYSGSGLSGSNSVPLGKHHGY
uniref:K Homology domain-containing protein n=1 Tax=Ananas comosus var. bracteatus TaxID=296719 RepID=A0A6V7QRL2_ANACO